jgi:tight adherence protein B
MAAVLVALLAGASAAALLAGPLVSHGRPDSPRPVAGGPSGPGRPPPLGPHEHAHHVPGRRLAWWAWWRRPSADAQLEAMARVCAAAAAELRAGRRREEALEIAVAWTFGQLPEPLLAASRAGVVGGDVAATLRHSSHTSSHASASSHLTRPPQPLVVEGLAALAACWEATGDTGAGLAVALDRLGGALRASAEHQRDVAAQLAGTRATARVLAALPALGLGLGVSLGADPFGFLFGSPVGIACLVAGLLLQVAGMVWTRRLTRQAGWG